MYGYTALSSKLQMEMNTTAGFRLSRHLPVEREAALVGAILEDVNFNKN